MSKKSMDLSNLSSDLPPTKAVSDASINELNRELTTEFKNAAKSVAALYNSGLANGDGTSSNKTEFASAAKSVAALYRLSHSCTSLVYQKGYLDCLDDLLDLLTVEGDVENWALTKRAEITNLHNNTTTNATTTTTSSPPANVIDAVSTTAQRDIDPISDDLQIPADYEFTISSDLRPSGHFRSSVTPLSVQHTHKQRLNFKNNRKYDPVLRRKLRLQSSAAASNSQDDGDIESNTTDRESQSSSEDDIDNDSPLSKRKNVQNNLGSVTKKKKTL